jgi:predicted metal-dependent hydrolase
MTRANDLPFLGGYPESTLAQVRALIAQGRLAEHLKRRYPDAHAVRNDAALYEHVMALKARHLRNAPVLAKVIYDNRLQIDQRALGTLTAVSRVQGGQLKAKREIRVAAVFKDAPAEMLQMIVVHELAHLKEREHDKAFYALCEHMLPDYHQIEFDTRLYLTWKALDAAASAAVQPPPSVTDSTR